MEFSFFSMVANASLVAQCVLFILFIMSIGSWGLIIQKAILLGAAQRKSTAGIASFEKAAFRCSARIRLPRCIPWPRKA